MKRHLFCVLLVASSLGLGAALCESLAHASPKPKQPHIVMLKPQDEGADFIVNNPLRKKVMFRFECRDAFSVLWLELPARSTKVVQVRSTEPITGPCTLVWKVRR